MTPASERLNALMIALRDAPTLVQSALQGREMEAGQLLVEGSREAFHPHSKTEETEESFTAHVLQAAPGRKAVSTVGLYGALPAKWIITGTRPHMIEAHLPPWALHFEWANGPNGPGDYFFRFVHHPGTKKDDWRPEAVRNIVPRVRELGLDTARLAVTNIKRRIKE